MRLRRQAMWAAHWLPILQFLLLSVDYRSCLSVKVQGKACLDGTVRTNCDEADEMVSHGHMEKGSRKATSALQHSFFQMGDGEVVNSKPANSYWFFSNPLALGLALGLLLIGPDHLGTLMALSTLTTGFTAFKVGFAWGIGHSIGMILIMPMFFLLKKLSTKTLDFPMESWEYYGDYCIGASMVLISFYFILYEHHYIEQKEDGTYGMKGCGCCPEVEAPAESATDNESGTDLRNICRKYGAGNSRAREASPAKAAFPAKDLDASKQQLNDEASSTAWARLWKPMFSARDWQGAMIGILQGLCCPTGLMGIGFMGKIGTNSSVTVLLAFSVVFLMTSGIGSGAITFGWGMLSSRGLAGCISPRAMYLSSCVATGLLGLLWVVANAAGVLHHINYAENFHSHHHGTESSESLAH